VNDLIIRPPSTRRRSRDVARATTARATFLPSSSRVAFTTTHDDDDARVARASASDASTDPCASMSRRRRRPRVARRFVVVACLLYLAFRARPARGARATEARRASIVVAMIFD
jgi:hypothetical protein|tara:strand:+ start:423 stop:764 length:342 start_codon:yes stop_codon:yes gene_type:complete